MYDDNPPRSAHEGSNAGGHGTSLPTWGDQGQLWSTAALRGFWMECWWSQKGSTIFVTRIQIALVSGCCHKVPGWVWVPGFLFYGETFTATLCLHLNSITCEDLVSNEGAVSATGG